MTIIKIFFEIISIILIIVALKIYFNMKKEFKSDIEIDKKYIEKKVNLFTILIITSIILSLIISFVRIIDDSLQIRENININPNNYNMYIEGYKNNSDIHSELGYFPQKIESDHVLDFAEYNRDGLFDGSYFIYLKYKYNENDFKDELEKIEKISNKKINDNNNQYVAYVLNDDGYNTKEYVLIDEDNKTMVYVFCQLFYSSEINVDKNYFLD